MAYKFGIFDAKVAVWNSAQNWGSAQDLDGVQMMQVTLNTVNGVLEGDDQIKDVHAKTISVSVRLRFAFATLAVYEILTGDSHTDSGDVEDIVFTVRNMPYFGICGRMDHTEGGGDFHLFVGKCKIMEGFSLSFEYGRYATPELNCMAVNESSTYGLFKVIEHDTAQAVTIPPT